MSIIPIRIYTAQRADGMANETFSTILIRRIKWHLEIYIAMWRACVFLAGWPSHECFTMCLGPNGARNIHEAATDFWDS